ncbi:MAG: serine/threonine protein kinase [Planctomycetes bacterium]|nr:serine/threonine protein kinase [Planctomycetota bacterium]MBI3835272.1 serine/threonine protein kinase [Planctomycetota bacterium]
MNPISDDRAQLIKRIFDEACALSGDSRERYLNESCAADLLLRDQVEKLLHSDEHVHGRFLQESTQPKVESRMPQRIRGFRLLRKIGEGGMGSVFEAEQEHPRRKVALKVVRFAMVSDSIVRRFEYEVQILGQLKHPGIAQIYEAGMYDDGAGPVPYFAMEYIQGRALLEFVAHHRLSIRQRLELFADICDAVHHAHQKGVIHRDLKPANILVEESHAEKPHPKILDFGVARAVHSDLKLVTMHTEAGQLMGTLSYMSPEQIAGRPDELDVRSDVYTLGVILYELLASRRPYDLAEHSIPEAGRMIREMEPPLLGAIDPVLRGDVETIVAKALTKEKEHRYQSAVGLGEDIRLYLRDEPITARPASATYHIRKFAKRNKAIVGGVAAVFITLVIAVIGITASLLKTREAQRVAIQRSDESQRSAAKAMAVNNFLQEMLSSVDPAKSLGREITIRQALDEAAVKIESGTLKDQPAIEADLRTTIGTTYLGLGHYDEAEPQLRAALDIRRRLCSDACEDVAVSLTNLAYVYSAQGRHAEEESILRDALEMQTRLHGPKHADVASTMQSLGAALRSQQKLAEAEPFYRNALIMRRELLPAEHLDVAQSINSLALLLQDKGDAVGAEPLFREALAMRRKLLGDPHPIVADSLNNLANLLTQRRKTMEAESLLREALAMRRKVLKAEHPQVAQSLNNLAFFLYDNGNYEGAETLYREALAIWRRTLPEGHIDIGNATAGLGLVLLAQKSFAEAEPLLRESLLIRESVLPEGHWRRFATMSVLGAALAGEGKFAEAEPYLIHGYEGLKSQPQLPRKYKQEALQRIIDLYESCNQLETAGRWRSELTTRQTDVYP